MHTWIKKQGSLFDVSMAAYDGAEVSELVSRYMLLSHTYIYYLKSTTKTILGFIVMMDWPFSKLKVDHNQNR